MENASKALGIAFAVIVLVMALSITIYMFAQARETADAVIHSSDITEYIEYDIEIKSGNREVGLETIIPTLYRYYKENYTVVFLDKNGKPLPAYRTITNKDSWGSGYWLDKYGDADDDIICSFDVNEEISRGEPWTGSADDYKKNIDALLYGKPFKGTSYNSFIGIYAEWIFTEFLGEYSMNQTDEEDDSKEQKKRVIIYKLNRTRT